MKIEIDVDIPKGYEFDRYGYLVTDEPYLTRNGELLIWAGSRGSHCRYVVLKKNIQKTLQVGLPEQLFVTLKCLKIRRVNNE